MRLARHAACPSGPSKMPCRAGSWERPVFAQYRTTPKLSPTSVVGPGGMAPLSASSSATLAAHACARTELAPCGMSQ
eukprot:224602-Lingulodinium_polyedra.AAC.1